MDALSLDYSRSIRTVTVTMISSRSPPKWGLTGHTSHFVNRTGSFLNILYPGLPDLEPFLFVSVKPSKLLFLLVAIISQQRIALSAREPSCLQRGWLGYWRLLNSPASLCGNKKFCGCSLPITAADAWKWDVNIDTTTSIAVCYEQRCLCHLFHLLWCLLPSLGTCLALCGLLNSALLEWARHGLSL